MRKLLIWLRRFFDRKVEPQPKEPCHILSSSADVGAYTPCLTYSDSPNRELNLSERLDFDSKELKRLEEQVNLYKAKLDETMLQLVKFHFSATKK